MKVHIDQEKKILWIGTANCSLKEIDKALDVIIGTPGWKEYRLGITPNLSTPGDNCPYVEIFNFDGDIVYGWHHISDKPSVKPTQVHIEGNMLNIPNWQSVPVKEFQRILDLLLPDGEQALLSGNMAQIPLKKTTLDKAWDDLVREVLFDHMREHAEHMLAGSPFDPPKSCSTGPKAVAACIAQGEALTPKQETGPQNKETTPTPSWIPKGYEVVPFQWPLPQGWEVVTRTGAVIINLQKPIGSDFLVGNLGDTKYLWYSGGTFYSPIFGENQLDLICLRPIQLVKPTEYPKRIEREGEDPLNASCSPNYTGSKPYDIAVGYGAIPRQTELDYDVLPFSWPVPEGCTVWNREGKEIINLKDTGDRIYPLNGLAGIVNQMWTKEGIWSRLSNCPELNLVLRKPKVKSWVPDGYEVVPFEWPVPDNWKIRTEEGWTVFNVTPEKHSGDGPHFYGNLPNVVPLIRWDEKGKGVGTCNLVCLRPIQPVTRPFQWPIPDGWEAQTKSGLRPEGLKFFKVGDPVISRICLSDNADKLRYMRVYCAYSPLNPENWAAWSADGFWNEDESPSHMDLILVRKPVTPREGCCI